ncbi:MAG: hypothetical protein WA726_07355 [Acidimicrobiia bacterium]
MEEIWTKAFSRSCDTLSVADRIVIDGVLDELLERHGSAEMRHSLMNVASEKIWATRRIHLNADLVRITWMYGESADTIVMLSLASVESE